MDEEWRARIEATAALLRHACREMSAWVSGDGRVSEETAAKLLDLEPATLAKWRQASSGPVFYRLGGRGYKVSYRLADVAEYIERSRVG
jgi:hypothetical protein